MTGPFAITDEEEVAAITAELRDLERCASCGGGPALLVEHGTVEPFVAHAVDCAGLLASAVEIGLDSLFPGEVNP
ncbi:hypothetical protein ACFSVJ_08140 [Prauserella oleivorans]